MDIIKKRPAPNAQVKLNFDFIQRRKSAKLNQN